MKKSVLAVSVIGALALAWAGGTWYSGKLLETKYTEQIDELNKMIGFYLPAGGEVAFTYQNVSYQRGFLGAEIQDKLVLKDKDGQYEILLDSTIQHGPLPLSNLAKFKLKPVLAAGQTALGKNELVEPWFELSKAQNPLTIDFSLGYNNQVVSQTRVAALEYLKNNTTFSMSEVVIDSDTNLQGIGDVKLNWDHLSFSENADNKNSSENNELKINGIKLDSSLQATQWQDLAVGTQTLSIKEITLAIQSDEPSDSVPVDIKLNELVLVGETKLNNGFFDVLFQLNLDKILVLNKHDLGKLQFDFALKHLDGQALNDLTEAFKAIPIDGQPTPEQDEKAQSAALTILAKKPELQFSLLAWSNGGGISQLTLDLGVNFTEADSADEMANPDPLRFLSKFDFNAEIDKKMLQQLLTQIANIKSETEQERLTPEQITQEADEGYQHMLQLLTENGSFIETPEAFSAKVLLENGQLKYNGEVVPQETIEQVFMTALFALGQTLYSDGGLEYDEDYYNSLYDETDSEAAEFGEDDEALFLPNGEFELAIPDLSPSDLQGLPPAMPQ